MSSLILKKNADNAVKIRSYTHVAASDNALLCAVAKQPIAVSLNATDFQHYASVSLTSNSISILHAH